MGSSSPMGMCENVLQVLKVCMGNGIGKGNAEERKLPEFRDEKRLCVANAWFYKAKKSKVMYSAGGYETKIDFMLLRKNAESM